MLEACGPNATAPAAAPAVASGAVRPGDRSLFKGRLQPPQRDPLASYSSEPAIRQHELTVERPNVTQSGTK